VTAPPADWSDRFRAARKAAGFSSSQKLAKRLGASRRAALRWETGEGLPRKYVDEIAALSPELAAVIAELPYPDDRRGLHERVVALERRVGALEALLAESIGARP
jgi:transcriptional regulator with XRE-family HTH domain